MSVIIRWITIGIAVLPVVKLIIDLKRYRPRLKVSFRSRQKTCRGMKFEVRYIEVVNVGDVPVAIARFGIKCKKCFVYIEEVYSDGSRGNRKLEPGDSCTVDLTCHDCAKPEMGYPLCAVVLTATNKEFVSDEIHENLNLVAEKMGW